MKPLPSAMLIVTWLLLTSAAGAVTPGTLVGQDLTPQPITVQGLREGTLLYFDAKRQLRSEPVSRLLQLRFAAPVERDGAARRQQAPGVVELTDGQRLVGQWAGAAENGEGFRWRHPVLGEMSLSLEKLSAMRLGDARLEPLPVGQLAGDRVVMTNGDALAGFVAAFSAQGLELQQAEGGKNLALPIERLREVRLANPVQREADATLVHLHDGSRIIAQSLSLRNDEAHLTPALRPQTEAKLPLAQVARVDFAAGALGLVDLAQLTPVSTGGEVFGLPWPPRATERGLSLHAPVTLRVDLPAGATRFAAQAELDLPADAAETQKQWADCWLILRVDDRELGRYRLRAAEPSATINVAAEGLSLSIELDPGANGPVMDRVLLRDAVVLVKRIID